MIVLELCLCLVEFDFVELSLIENAKALVEGLKLSLEMVELKLGPNDRVFAPELLVLVGLPSPLLKEAKHVLPSETIQHRGSDSLLSSLDVTVFLQN